MEPSTYRIAVVVSLVTACALLTTNRAEAQYNRRFDAINSGGILFAGNSLGLDGEDDDNGQGTRGGIATFITTDTTLRDTTPPADRSQPFPFGTTNDWTLNRSAAPVRLPAGARVLHAELVWGGTFAGESSAENVSAFIDDAISFTTPNGTFDVDPDPTTGEEDGEVQGGECRDTGCFYVRSADVTALVRAAGAGTYAVGRVPATQGTNDNNSPSAGWTLAIAYEDFTKPIRSLSLFQGMEASGGAAASVAGFCTPVSGPLAGRLAVSAMEGDAVLTGDRMLFGPSSNLDDDDDRVQGPRNPSTNFFAGQIVYNGNLDTEGTFGDRNHTPDHPEDGSRQGWDITDVDVSERLENDQTQAFAQGTTTGDNYRILALGLQIDIAAPRFDDPLSKSVDRTTAAIGDVLTYTVRINNSSIVDADNVVFTDTPPAGTSFVAGSFTIDGAPQASADPTVGVPLGTVAAGEGMVVTFQARIDSIPPGPNPQIRSNTARWTFDFVSCAGVPPIPATSESNSVVTEVPVADLSITKSFVDATAVAGAPVTYELVVANAGPSAVTGAPVADAGTTPALTGITWTCVPNPGASSCAAPSGTGPLSSTVNMPVGGGATFTVTGTLPANTPAGTTLTNSASIAAPAGAPDPNLANNTATADVTTAVSADLRLTKSGPPEATPGTNVTYTLTVTNNGPSAAEGVVVDDPTPAGLVVVTPLSGPCSTAPGCAIAAGASETLTITFEVPPAYAGADPIVNTATVAGTTPDPRTINNTAIAMTSLGAPVADLSIAKTNNTTTLVAGSTTTYTITVTNLGPATAAGTQVSDTFDPAVFANVQWECTAAGTSTCQTTGPQPGNISALLDIDPGAGNAVTFTVTAQVADGAAGTVSNTATVAVATGVTDPDSSNNDATDTDTLEASADLAVTIVGPAEIVAGQLVTYTVTVTNNGPSTAPDAPIALRIRDAGGTPQPTWIEGFTPPIGLTCSLVDFGVLVPEQLPVCVIPTLAPTESVVISVPVLVPGDYAPPLPADITAEAFIPSYAVADSNPANNSDTWVAPLAFEADLSITKTGPVSTLSNRIRSFYLHVANNGPSIATDIVIDDPVPAGLTVVAIDSEVCSSFPCTVPQALPGANADIRVDVLVPLNFAEPSFVNIATVSAGTPDPIPGNNSSTTTTNVVAEETDLSLTKIGPASTAPGGSLTYTIVVTDEGPGRATGVTMTDVTPTGTTFVSIVTPPLTTCQTPAVGSAGTIVCETPLLLPFAQLEYQVTLQADAGLTAGTTIRNLALVTSDVPDFDTSNDSAVVSTIVAAATDADLSVTKIGTPNPVVTGSNVTFTVTVRNAGPAAATGVSVTDTLPAGFTLVSATPSQGTCAAAVCTIGSLAAGAEAAIEIVATATASGTSDNVATVTGDQTDPVTANNTATLPTTAGAADEADLLVEKSGPDVLQPGQSSGYVLRVTNRGPGTATGVVLDDPLPAEVVFTSNSPTCTAGFPCSLETLLPGETRVINVTFAVPAGLATPATATNTATVTSVSVDPDLANNSATVVSEIHPGPGADLQMTKVGMKDPVVAGTTFSYAIVATNRGPEPATGVQVTDTLPPGTTLITATPSQGTCTGTTTITCALGDIPPGSHAIVVLTVEAPPTVPTPNPMINSATATSDSDDPEPSNDTGETPTTVVGAIADLSITKTPSALTVTAGTALTWTILVSNAGPSHIVGAAVVDTLPAAFLNATWTCTASAGSACGLAAGTGSIGTTVDLVVGGTATFVVAGTVDPAATVGLSNTATVAAPAGATDPDPSDNSATSVVAVTQSADVSVVKTSPASVFAGGTVTYTIAVTSAGPSTATNVVVDDPTPAGLAFVANSGDCTTPFPCALGAIEPGGTRTITATYTVLATATSPITNTATGTSDVPDPDGGDNSSTIDTLVADAQTDLAITKSGPSSVGRLGALAYELVIRNAGPVDATDVVITDALPGGTTFVSVTAASPTTCTAPAVGATGLVTCQTPLIAAGGEVRIQIAAQAIEALPLGTRLTNVATVSSAISDIDTSNNRAELATAVAAATDADLIVTISDVPDPVAVGGDIIYTVTVTNQGPAAATNVALTNTLPAGLTLVSSAPSQGSCTGATCALGTLAPGAGASVLITATATTAGLFTTTASATATERDLVPANNTASQETTAGTAVQADVAVEISGPTTLAPGQVAIFETRITNRGPAAALNVQVNGLLPAEFLFGGNSGDCATAFPCALGTMAVGQTRSIFTAVTVNPAAAVPATVTTTATVSSTSPDPVSSNNTTSQATDLYASGSTDLLLSKRGSPTVTVTGGALSYTIAVANRGPTTATGVTVTDVVPADVTILSVTASQGTCSTSAPVSCALGVMPPGSIALIEILAEAPTSVPTPNPMVNTASVSASEPDPVPANNEGVALTSIGAVVVDLAVTKTAAADTVDAGTPIGWTIVVTNNGPGDVTGATVNDPFPASITDATWTCTATTGSACAVSSGTGPIATTVDLLAGGIATFQVTATAPGLAIGGLTNMVTVAAPDGTFDVDPANNSASSTVNVTLVANLRVAKAGPSRVPAGGTISYTVTVDSVGPSPADLVILQDPTPAGLTFISNAGDCTTPFPCLLGVMPIGSTRTVTSTYRVATGPRAPAAVVNIASATTLTQLGDRSVVIATSTAAVSRGTSCDIDLDGIEEIVTGAGPGGGPHVRMLKVNGSTVTEVNGFYAYDPAFIGGVFVACGDVNGDGRAEVITGAGAGGGPHVRIFDFSTNVTEIGSFYAYDPHFLGGVRVAVGDVNGDGFAEVITGAGPGGGPHVRVFDFQRRVFTELSSFYAYDPAFIGGVTVAAGDIDGDGVEEVLTGAGPAGGPHVRGFKVDGDTVTEAATFYAYDPNFIGGVHVAAGDVTGDGIAEIITGAGPLGGSHVRVFDPTRLDTEIASFYAYDPAFIGGVHVGATDVDGNGLAEIVTGAGPAGGPHVRVMRVGGGTVTEVASFYAYDPAFIGGVHVASIEPHPNAPLETHEAAGPRRRWASIIQDAIGIVWRRAAALVTRPLAATPVSEDAVPHGTGAVAAAAMQPDARMAASRRTGTDGVEPTAAAPAR